MKNLLLFIIALSFSSCIKEIAIDHPQDESLLTLNCVIRQGEPIRASLSSTMPFNSAGYTPYFKDGFLMLFENGLVVDTMKICGKEFLDRSNDTIWYYCSSYPTAVGSVYSIEASREGFPKVIGNTRIPDKPKVISVKSNEGTDFGEIFEIQIEDNDPEENFYMLQMRTVDDLGIMSTVLLLSNDPTLSIYQSYIGFELPTEEVSGITAYFSEKYFVNKRRTIKIRASSINGLSVNQILLTAVSQEYFNYRKGLEINDAVGQNPFTEPIRIKSNVQGGFGIMGSENLNLFKF